MTSTDTTSGLVAQAYHTINRPVEFPGTAEERAENYATHSFFWGGDPEEGGDVRCGSCDSRPSHVAASYPCLADVPRETVLWVRTGSTVAISGEGTVDFVHADGTTSGVLTPPSNGAPAFVTGVEGLSFRLNGDLTLAEA